MELNEFLLKEHNEYRSQYDDETWEYIFEKNFRKGVSLVQLASFIIIFKIHK